MLDNRYKNAALELMEKIQKKEEQIDNLRSFLNEEDLEHDELTDIQDNIRSLEGEVYKLFQALPSRVAMYLEGFGNA